MAINTEFQDEAMHKLFVEGFRGTGIDAYSSKLDGTVILTSDPKVIEMLKLAQKNEINADNQDSIEPISRLGLVSIDIPSLIPRFYPNVLFLRYGKDERGFAYDQNETGVERTLILSKTSNGLKRFVSPLVVEYLDSLDERYGDRSPLEKLSEDSLKIGLVVNNKRVPDLINDGYYNSRALLQSAVEDVVVAINDAQNEASEKKEGYKS